MDGTRFVHDVNVWCVFYALCELMMRFAHLSVGEGVCE